MTQPVHRTTSANAFLPAEYTPAQEPEAEPAEQQPVAPPSEAEKRVERLRYGFAKQGAEDAQRAELREKHGALRVLGEQSFRGIFDAILTPGALAGAGLETAGTALGSEFVRDLGRDIGRSSSGLAAAELLSELSGVRAGQATQDFAEQEQARPLLSTVARGSGMVGIGLASGGVGGLRSAAAVGALEGAGAGAQSAYENNAPLQDVLASSAIGSVLGAAGPAGLAGVQAGYRAAARKFAGADVGGTLKAAMSEFAQERVFKAMGARGTDFRKLGRNAPAAEREMRQVADDVIAHKLDDGTPVFQGTQTQEELAERVLAAQAETGAKLGALRREVNDFVEGKAPTLRPVPNDIATKIEAEVIQPLQRSQLTANEAARVQIVANELRAMGQTASLEQLGTYQKLLKDKVYPKPAGPGLPPQVPEAAIELQKAERLIEDYATNITDRAAAAMGGDQAGAYQRLKRQYQSMTRASQITGKAELQDLGNRVLSPSDYLIGAGTLAGDLASGGALSALKAAGAAGLHKMIRERSSSVLAVLASRLSRTPKPAFSVAKVGGREAQEALENLAQVRNFMRETGEAVGDNPNVRRVAEGEAKETAIEVLRERAGEFNPTRWADRSPSPLQKVLYRKEILDTAAADMAATAQRVAALRPELPDALDVQKLGKLMKEADRPVAIGALQNKLTELANSVPQTSGGADLGMILRRAVDKLETAEADEAFQIGHVVRTEIARARQVDEAMGLRRPADAAGFDEARFDDAFQQQASSQIRDVLSSDPFGEAGALYRAATHRSDAHEKLTDVMALREALRTADQRGPLPGALHDANEAILAAATARAKLTGEKLPPGLERELRRSEELFAAGEEAATLDGRSVSRLFEHLDDAPKGPDPQKAVWDAVAPEIDRLVPIIKAEAGQSKRGRYRPTLGRVAAQEANEREFQLPEEQRIEYDQRLDQVAEVLAEPKHIEATGVEQSIAPVVGQKLAQFMNDVPKPRQDIRGKAFETMSSNDLRLAAAMYEATVKPLSVLSDFRAGIVDYDKVQYAWKQWPGLQVAVQAGILDVLQQDLDDDEREGLSDTMLTQLDLLAGFGGRLQSSLDPAFSARIDSLNTQPEPAKPPSGGGALSTPKAEPTFTQRVAGAQT